jgi:hypothetical protein
MEDKKKHWKNNCMATPTPAITPSASGKWLSKGSIHKGQIHIIQVQTRTIKIKETSLRWLTMPKIYSVCENSGPHYKTELITKNREL